MFKLNHLSLGRRLALGFAIPLIALVAVAGIGIQSIDWASQELSDAGTEDMPISVSASAINDVLMNEALEYQAIQREYFALHANEFKARDRFEAAVKRFEAIVPQSDKNFESMRTLAAKAKDSDDPADVATYGDVERRVGAIDKAQTAYEEQIRAVIGFLDVEKLADAQKHMAQVESLQAAAQQEIRSLVQVIGKITADNVHQAALVLFTAAQSF